MENGSDSAKVGRSYRWRPTVPPFRPPKTQRSRPTKPTPDQMMLPGMEAGTESSPGAETIEPADRGLPTAEPHARGPDPLPDPPPSQSDLVCPNCGGTDFDDDGDCIRCWEPGVARADAEGND